MNIQSFKDAGKIDKVDNLRYFTGTQLERVQKGAAKKWDVVKIEFDRPRAAETYESCHHDNVRYFSALVLSAHLAL